MYERLKTEKVKEINDLLLSNIFSYANSDNSRKALKSWLDDSDPVFGSSEKLSLSKKWQIVYKIQKCDFVSEADKKTYWSKMVEEDTTDMKRDYQQKLEVLNATAEQRQAFVDRMLSVDSELSLKDTTNLGVTLNSKYSPLAERRIWWDQFWTMMPEIANKRSNEISKMVFIYMCPKSDGDCAEIVAKLKEMLPKIDESRKYMTRFVKTRTDMYDSFVSVRAKSKL